MDEGENGVSSQLGSSHESCLYHSRPLVEPSEAAPSSSCPGLQETLGFKIVFIIGVKINYFRERRFS